MLESKEFIYVGFMCHQAIEKILKGIYSQKFDETPPRTHNLARLLEITELEDQLPSDMQETLKELNPFNVVTSYPEENLAIMDDFTQKYSEDLLHRNRLKNVKSSSFVSKIIETGKVVYD